MAATGGREPLEGTRGGSQRRTLAGDWRVRRAEGRGTVLLGARAVPLHGPPPRGPVPVHPQADEHETDITVRPSFYQTPDIPL
jgi:hypothetical protein